MENSEPKIFRLSHLPSKITLVEGEVLSQNAEMAKTFNEYFTGISILEGIFSMIDILNVNLPEHMIPPPKQFLTNLYVVVKPIKNCSIGKELSIFFIIMSFVSPERTSSICLDRVYI